MHRSDSYGPSRPPSSSRALATETAPLVRPLSNYGSGGGKGSAASLK
jgi:hypothetical protein